MFLTDNGIFRSALTILASAWLLAASPAPVHVQTSDYFGGYAGTHKVEPQAAARWLTWAETNIPDSVRLRALGVRTILYTDPNRAISGEPEYTTDETSFAHDCGGSRIATSRAGQYLMDPHSRAIEALWKKHVESYSAEGHFDAVLNDDADDVAYVRGVPCNYSQADWLRATNALQRSLNYPVIYNGLSNFSDATVPASIGLNATAIGGMMEECYAPAAGDPRPSGEKWLVEEATELVMARERKYFFCYGNDTTAADRALDARLYTYASFLLTYDPAYSVLWEYYQGPSGFHVMPEAQLVPLRPREQPHAISDLRAPGGDYERAFAQCYLAGRSVGPCVVAVNPDEQTHSLALPGYRHTLVLSGGGVLDGGTARIGPSGPPSELAPLGAVIAFK